MEVARFQGLSIKVHPTFFLVLLAYAALGEIAQAFLVFSLVIGHELAHLLTARAYGFRVIGLELFPFGGAAYCEDLFEGRRVEESVMALAGPVFNLTLLFAAQALRWEGYWTGELSESFVQFNFWLAVFNLLPVLPLDGGRVVRALFSDVFGFVQTTKALARGGQFVGCLLALGGLSLITKGNAMEGHALATGALDGIVMLFILAGFFWLSGKKEVEAARITFLRQLTRKKEELIRKGLMKNKGISVTPETPLIRIVEKLTPDRYALINIAGKSFSLEKSLTETEVVEGILKYGIHHPVGKL